MSQPTTPEVLVSYRKEWRSWDVDVCAGRWRRSAGWRERKADAVELGRRQAGIYRLPLRVLTKKQSDRPTGGKGER